MEAPALKELARLTACNQYVLQLILRSRSVVAGANVLLTKQVVPLEHANMFCNHWERPVQLTLIAIALIFGVAPMLVPAVPREACGGCIGVG